MLYHTKGIVFYKVKYSDTSYIIKVYTELFGLQSYLIRRSGNKKSLVKPTLIQPLTLVELVVYHKEKKEVQHLKEIKIAYPFTSIHHDIRKSSVLIFLNEMLYMVIREQELNPDLFRFLYNSIVSLDQFENNISDFHLHFLMQLTKYIGFFPKNNFSQENSVFNLQEGVFTNQIALPEITITSPFSDYFAGLINAEQKQFCVAPIHRQQLLEFLIQFYKFHVPDIKEIKSHHVLQSVLND